MGQSPLAVFDVDRTCVDGMTGFLFSSHLFSRRMVGRAARWDVARTMLRYRLGLSGQREMVRIGVTVLRDLPESAVRQAAAEAFELRIRPRMLRGALKTAQSLTARDVELIVASGSSRYIVERIGHELGACDVLATDNEVRDGVCSDRPLEPLCFGKGKLELLQRALKSRGLSVEQVALYTDNYSDLSLLERVAEPHVVNPEPLLEQLAEQRGWPVHHWLERLDGSAAGGSSFPIRQRARSNK
ncbi:MAG: HAD family phosphatase [Candidatus Alcyoniella australis]|nr:HAD family phosphatase [Candidatus Alcyoniella australis]